MRHVFSLLEPRGVSTPERTNVEETIPVGEVAGYKNLKMEESIGTKNPIRESFQLYFFVIAPILPLDLFPFDSKFVSRQSALHGKFVT